MDFEAQAMIEANELSSEQFESFLDKVETIPAARSPITGRQARLFFEFMEDTGSRVTEGLHVRKKDIDFNTHILTVIYPKSEKSCKCSRWKYKDQYTRQRVLEYADPKCEYCHGKGKWKKPQKTTFTNRIYHELYQYCQELKPDDLLWPTTRQSIWNWGKKAGYLAGINIFQQKEEQLIKGIFPHLFRAICSKRTTADAATDKYKDALVQLKMRHSYKVVTDRYTKITINYLITFESKTYPAAL